MVLSEEQGRVLGRHKGLHLFTVGQRRGINCPSSEPYYVLRMDRGSNQLVVGSKNDLYATECQVDSINWIQPPANRTINVHVKVRYRHTAVPAAVSIPTSGRAVVHFDQPETAVTPGQGAVFYRGDEVLGGDLLFEQVPSAPSVVSGPLSVAEKS